MDETPMQKAERLAATELPPRLEFRVSKSTRPTLEEAQAFVGGFVELVRLEGGSQMLVNEEGLLRGLPLNQGASILAGRPIVGPVLVLEKAARWR